MIQADLSKGPPTLEGPFDALIIPNLLCYLTAAGANALLTGLKPYLVPGCEVFVRTRMIDDYRHWRGTEEEPHGYRIATPETGEAGPGGTPVRRHPGLGDCFRVYIYESGGRTLLTAECVREAEPKALRDEIKTLLAGFDGDLALGEQLWTSVKPRWIYHSLEAIRGLATLRATRHQRMGAGFVSGAWEAYSKAEKFAQVNAGLAQALGPDRRAVAA